MITITVFDESQTFDPVPPHFHHPPLKIAKDTWLIRQLQGEGEMPEAVYMNSMVILGEQPVIVDTGTAANRKQWMDDVFSLVDPEDVRWLYFSHDDSDHTGNLVEVLKACRNATFVSTWFQLERLTCDLDFPMRRLRWINDGESFDIGDRKLTALRPPIFDSPTTRGLYDPRTRVYWASDTFATPVTEPVDYAADIEQEYWHQGMNILHSFISPWVHMTDPAKFNRYVDRIAELDIEVAVGGHTPPVRCGSGPGGPGPDPPASQRGARASAGPGRTRSDAGGHDQRRLTASRPALLQGVKAELRSSEGRGPEVLALRLCGARPYSSPTATRPSDSPCARSTISRTPLPRACAR